ncbi:MAG: hypothetical protein ACRDIY_16220, partial [Chloroflexota bacterium]
LKERHGESDLTQILQEIGQRMGRERAAFVLGRSGRARVEAIAEVIDDLGGDVEVMEDNGQLILAGYSCPLVAVAADHVEVCVLMRALIETLLGEGHVQECCDRPGDVHCRFTIDPQG